MHWIKCIVWQSVFGINGNSHKKYVVFFLCKEKICIFAPSKKTSPGGEIGIHATLRW